MKKTILPLCLLLGTCLSAQLGEPDKPKADERVKERLESLNLKYKIEDSGRYKLVFETENKRTQLVFMLSQTYVYNDIEVREVFSPVMHFKDKSEIDDAKLFDLLKRNGTYKMGGWQIDGDGPYALNFALRIAANANAKSMEELIKFAAKAADEYEVLISQEDKF